MCNRRAHKRYACNGFAENLNRLVTAMGFYSFSFSHKLHPEFIARVRELELKERNEAPNNR